MPSRAMFLNAAMLAKRLCSTRSHASSSIQKLRGALAWPGSPPHKPGSGQLPDVDGKRGSTGSDCFGNLARRLFAGSKNAQVATLTENMARLGHKTVGAALRYQHSESGRDAIVAASLSATRWQNWRLPQSRSTPTKRRGHSEPTRPRRLPRSLVFFAWRCPVDRRCSSLNEWVTLGRTPVGGSAAVDGVL